MPIQLVDVIAPDGHVLRRYAVALDHADCVEAEYEEAALVFAEHDRLVEASVLVRAHCVR